MALRGSEGAVEVWVVEHRVGIQREAVYEAPSAVLIMEHLLAQPADGLQLLGRDTVAELMPQPLYPRIAVVIAVVMQEELHEVVLDLVDCSAWVRQPKVSPPLAVQPHAQQRESWSRSTGLVM